MNLTRFDSRISEVITYTKLEPTTLLSILLIGEISYNLILLCVGDLGPNLEQEEGEGEHRKGLKRQLPRAGERGLKYPNRAQTGQTGPRDRSDRSELQNPVHDLI